MNYKTGFTTGFLAVALGAAAIASAASPAAALPNKNIPAQFHPVMQPVNSPIKAQLPVVQLQPKKPPIVQLPQPPIKVLPPVVQLPHPIDNICPLNKFKCPPGPIPSPGKPGKPPVVVIVTPPIEVPVAVPVGIPSRIGGGGGVAYAGPARAPAAAQQCTAAGNTPELAAGIDELLPKVQLSDADKAQVTDLRQTIQVLAESGKVAAARDTEEVAMKILGYKKVSLGCGGFDWEQIVATTAAVQQK